MGSQLAGVAVVAAILAAIDSAAIAWVVIHSRRRRARR